MPNHKHNYRVLGGLPQERAGTMERKGGDHLEITRTGETKKDERWREFNREGPQPKERQSFSEATWFSWKMGSPACSTRKSNLSPRDGRSRTCLHVQTLPLPLRFGAEPWKGCLTCAVEDRWPWRRSLLMFALDCYHLLFLSFFIGAGLTCYSVFSCCFYGFSTLDWSSGSLQNTRKEQIHHVSCFLLFFSYIAAYL